MKTMNIYKLIIWNILVGIIILSCSNNTKWTCQKFVEEIVPIDFTMQSLIEKYGKPDKIIENVYNYDPSGKVIDIYYGENVFHFYLNSENNVTFPQDWIIRNNFKDYSSLFIENDINKIKITNTLGKYNFREYNIDGKNYIAYEVVLNKNNISYLINSELIFIFEDNNLIEIQWSMDR